MFVSACLYHQLNRVCSSYVIIIMGEGVGSRNYNFIF